MSTTLAALAADPERVADLDPAALPGLIGEVEALKARLWARLQAAGAAVTVSPDPKATPGADRLLTATEAAERLGVNARWLYRKADSLPFTRKLSQGTLRFSERGLERWQASR